MKPIILVIIAESISGISCLGRVKFRGVQFYQKIVVINLYVLEQAPMLRSTILRSKGLNLLKPYRKQLMS